MVFAWDCFFNVTLEKTCKYTNDFFIIIIFSGWGWGLAVYYCIWFVKVGV